MFSLARVWRINWLLHHSQKKSQNNLFYNNRMVRFSGTWIAVWSKYRKCRKVKGKYEKVNHFYVDLKSCFFCNFLIAKLAKWRYKSADVAWIKERSLERGLMVQGDTPRAHAFQWESTDHIRVVPVSTACHRYHVILVVSIPTENVYQTLEWILQFKSR